MRVRQNAFIRPLRMSGKEARGDRAGHWIVAPLQIERLGPGRFIRVSFALIDWRQKLVRAEIRGINHQDALKGQLGFTDATEYIQCLAQLPGYFTIPRILLGQPGKFDYRLLRFLLTS